MKAAKSVAQLAHEFGLTREARGLDLERIRQPSSLESRFASETIEWQSGTDVARAAMHLGSRAAGLVGGAKGGGIHPGLHVGIFRGCHVVVSPSLHTLSHRQRGNCVNAGGCCR